MSKALEGVRILDMTHVQAGPTGRNCWRGWGRRDQGRDARRGDITRGQLRDVKGADSLYFTMLNSNKRSITVNMKTPRARRSSRTVKRCDIVIENFGPGVLDRLGFTWEQIQEINPRVIMARSRASAPALTPTSRPMRTSRSAWAAR